MASLDFSVFEKKFLEAEPMIKEDGTLLPCEEKTFDVFMQIMEAEKMEDIEDISVEETAELFKYLSVISDAVVETPMLEERKFFDHFSSLKGEKCRRVL